MQSIMDHSIWAMVPPLLTIALVLITKEVILAMVVGVCTGCLLMASFHPMAALFNIVEVMVGSVDESGVLEPGAVTDPDNVMILLFMMLIGALLGLFTRSGSSQAFAEFLQHRITTGRKAQLMTVIVGLLLLIDDYFDTLTNSAVTRTIADRNSLSREK